MDFGMKNVVIRNLVKNTKQQYFETPEEVSNTIQQLKDQLDTIEIDLIELVTSVTNCDHDYKNPTHTIQRRIGCYMFVYEQTCKTCGYTRTESVKEGKEHEEAPDWAEGSKERYYNNYI